MKTFIGTLAGVGVVLSVTLALANPALLPKHPGYPASGYANDAGQTNMGGEKASLEGAKADSRHTAQDLAGFRTGRRYQYRWRGPCAEASRLL